MNIHMFLLGGTGAKIGNRLRKYDLDIDQLPGMTFDYFDASKSETTFVDGKQHIIDRKKGLSGSGGIRGESFSEIADQAPSMMLEVDFEPGDITFLVFSTGGGSGSAFAYVLLEQLIKDNRPVICFISNTPNTPIRANNASSSLVSIDNLAKEHDVTIPVYLYDTTEFESFTKQDQKIVRDIFSTSLVVSPTVSGIDDQDRVNFLNPNKVLGIDPGLGSLDVNINDVTTDQEIVCAMTLIKYGESDDIGHDTDLLFSGILSDDLISLLTVDGNPVDRITLTHSTDGALGMWNEKIKSKIAEIEKRKKLARSKTSISSTGSSGFVC